MKRLYSIVFAILLALSITGLAMAAVPQSVDPTAGPEVWTTTVYNNSGSTLDAGDVVVWDIGSSTGDNDNYVTTTTTADTFLVAGVVWPSDIAAVSIGSIAIRGIVGVDLAQPLAAGSLICSGATAGGAQLCSSPADDVSAFGFVTESGTTNVQAMIFGR